MKPFFTYYGGKWRAAPRYPKPACEVIVEPFAGAAGYSVRYADHKVFLIDSDPIISSLWRYLIDAKPSEILELPLLHPEQSLDDLEIPFPAKSLIGFWLNKGCASPAKRPSAWMRQGTHASSFWGVEIRQRISEQVSRIKHWEIIPGSYDCSPNIEATWFIDPPYIEAGKHYRHSADAIDFSRLASWCRGRKGQILVCENAGAEWLPFEPFQDIKASPGRQKSSAKSAEVLWSKWSLDL